MATPAQPPFGQRAKRAVTRLFVFALVAGLAGLVLFLLSQLNARTFTLVAESGHLVVMKGRNLPAGAVPYRPGDPALADAYAPLPLEGHDPGELTQRRFTERDELDRALFDLLERLAHPRVSSSEPAIIERGVYFVRRAARLSGLTDEQRRSLKGLEAEVAFFQARQRLEDARRQVSESLTQLKLAAESQNRHAREANQMLVAIGPAARALEEALRQGVHSIAAQAVPATPPVPAAPAAPEPAVDAGFTEERDAATP